VKSTVDSRQEQEFFLLEKTSSAAHPTSYSASGEGHFVGDKTADEVKLATQLHLELMVRMSASVSPFSRTLS